mmetsp:Transcript_65212/g.103319  ORF Transcript_65212/g.103319 Transcript_65212/m.103319 type:complete len:269 (+) Transcript_65212:27-833(+)
MGAAIRTLAFPHPPRQHRANALRRCPELVWVQTQTGGKTPAVHIKIPNSRLTLLYTHGNAEDLGDIVDLLRHTASACEADIFAVEIPGYSISEAEGPSEELMYEAVDAAYDYLVRDLQVPPSQIVPYGRSLGSAPAVHVASQHPEIRGLVLVSPLKSGGHAFAGPTISWFGYYIDPFKNYEKIERVQAQTCIIHGTADSVVPCSNGRGLYEQMQQRGLAFEPLWIEGRGHNDMPMDRVLMHVRHFLRSLFASGNSSSRPHHGYGLPPA